jgi:hypothetical protein
MNIRYCCWEVVLLEEVVAGGLQLGLSMPATCVFRCQDLPCWLLRHLLIKLQHIIRALNTCLQLRCRWLYAVQGSLAEPVSWNKCGVTTGGLGLVAWCACKQRLRHRCKRQPENLCFRIACVLSSISYAVWTLPCSVDLQENLSFEVASAGSNCFRTRMKTNSRQAQRLEPHTRWTMSVPCCSGHRNSPDGAKPSGTALLMVKG